MSKSLQTKLNIIILISLIISLLIYYFKIFPGLENSIIIIVGIISTIPVIISAAIALKNKKVTVDLLASLALLFSLLNKEWSSVAFINLMITSARIFGDYAESQADNAIKSLLKLKPEKVKIKKGGDIIETPIENVKLGDLILIEAGDRIPVDGVVIEGNASIDQSSLTGESLPINVSKNSKVLSSTLSLSGSLIIKAEKVGKDTTFEKIILLIQDAQNGKSSILTSADRFASFYIILTLVVSVTLFILTKDLNLILSVLLVACADDIAVAIPMAFWASIAKAAKKGIIIKGANFVEALADTKTIIMDKTGTLTRGVVKVQNIIPFGTLSQNQALTLIAQAESISEHPIAKAIVNYAKNLGIKIKTPEKFKEYSGKGVITYQNKLKITTGSLRFIKQEKIKITKDQLKVAQNFEADGFDVIFMGLNQNLSALITLADQVRPDAKPTITKLKNLGVINFIMLTGDNEKVAKRVADEVGISSFHANLLPGDKLKFVKSYLNKKAKVIMIGDGVNDAAALTGADIGIAMGAIGSDAAIESANIALMQDNFARVADTVKLGKHTKKIAQENFVMWGILNIIGLSLVFSKIIGPSGAATYNFVTDFFPIINALRIFKYKIISS